MQSGGLADAPPELLAEWMAYEEMANQRNNLEVMPIKYKGMITGLALVAKKGIKKGDELFVDYGFVCGHQQQKNKQTSEQIQRLRIMANPAILKRLSEKVELNEMD